MEIWKRVISVSACLAIWQGTDIVTAQCFPLHFLKVFILSIDSAISINKLKKVCNTKEFMDFRDKKKVFSIYFKIRFLVQLW